MSQASMAEAPPHEGLKDEARAWFEALRDDFCRTFEAIEDEQDGPLADRAPGRFERTAWQRPTESGAPGGTGARRRARPTSRRAGAA